MRLGCPVRFVEAAERFICPCHGGVYSFTGKFDSGPPVRRSIASTPRCGRRAVARAALLGQRGAQRFSPRDPAEPLDGIGQYLYPSRPTVRKLSGN